MSLSPHLLHHHIHVLYCTELHLILLSPHTDSSTEYARMSSKQLRSEIHSSSPLLVNHNSNSTHDADYVNLLTTNKRVDNISDIVPSYHSNVGQTSLSFRKSLIIN